MQIPPIGLAKTIVVWLYEQATRWLMFATYQESHERWARRHRLGAHWHDLGSDVEYSICFATPADPEPRTARIALRAAGEVDELRLTVDATGSGIRYQEAILLSDLDDRAIVRALPSMPYLDVFRDAEGGLRFTLESFMLTRASVRYRDGRTVQMEDSLVHSFTQTWLLQDEWVHRWGRWWNCNEIKFAKSELRNYWLFSFDWPRQRMPLVRRLLGASWFVTVQFWAAVGSRAFILDVEGRLAPRWSRTQVLA